MVGQSVQQSCGQLHITKHLRPLCKPQVGGDQHAGVLIQLGEQVKQQCAPGLTKRQIAQLIEDHQVHIHQLQGNLARLAMRLLLLQCVDQFYRREEANALGVLLYRLNPNFPLAPMSNGSY